MKRYLDSEKVQILLKIFLLFLISTKKPKIIQIFSFEKSNSLTIYDLHKIPNPSCLGAVMTFSD